MPQNPTQFLFQANARSYPPIGQCIYCGTREGKLTREHVMPLGLGGGFILPLASCELCRGITQKFETKSLRGFLFPFRIKAGLVRTPREIPKTKKILVGFEQRELNVPFEMIPLSITLPELIDSPGLIDMSGLEGHFPRHRLSTNFNNDEVIRLKSYVGSQIIKDDVIVDMRDYLRMIAKIAHGVAVAEKGLGSFTPYLSDFILGRKDKINPNMLFGKELWKLQPEDDKPTDKLHHFLGSKIDKHGLIVAQVQLFANYGVPAVSVVVGKIIKRPRKKLNVLLLITLVLIGALLKRFGKLFYLSRRD